MMVAIALPTLIATLDIQGMNIVELHGEADVMMSGLTVIPTILKHI